MFPSRLKAADALIWFGALVVKDSRVAEADNQQFLDLMEDYFDLPGDELKSAFHHLSRDIQLAATVFLTDLLNDMVHH